MEISSEQIIAFLASFFGGGGVGFTAVKMFMKNEAKLALKEEIEDIKKELKNIQDDYVTCKFCNMQHSNLDGMLKSINSKLDILIANKG